MKVKGLVITLSLLASVSAWAANTPILKATESTISLEKGVWKDYFSEIQVFESVKGADKVCYSAMQHWGGKSTMRLISGRSPCKGNISLIKFKAKTGKATDLILATPDAHVVKPDDSLTGCNGKVSVTDGKTTYSGQQGGTCRAE